MKYDFTTILERAGHDAFAIDALGMDKMPAKPMDGFSSIPMWVADMNFATFPGLISQIQERLKYPTFGYFLLREEFYQQIIWWHYHWFNVKGLKVEHILYSNSVLGSLVSILNALINKGDHVLVHYPTYIGFRHAIADAGYCLVETKLKSDDSKYIMDLADMEAKIIQFDIKVMVLCNPHNPMGRNWTKDELKEVIKLCKKHEVLIVADEIWADLILNDQPHIASYNINAESKKRVIALYSITKTFNVAGIGGSYIICMNEALRGLIQNELNSTCLNNSNVLAMHALLGAYTTDGANWVSELRSVLKNNMIEACNFFNQIEGVKFYQSEATYMLFLDFKKYCEIHQISFDDLLLKAQHVGVIWQDGRPFGGEATIRINLALPNSLLKEALIRLERYVLIKNA